MTIFEKTIAVIESLQTQKIQGHAHRMTPEQVSDFNDGIGQAICLIQIAVEESSNNARLLKTKLQTVYDILINTEDENVYRDTGTRKAVDALVKILPQK